MPVDELVFALLGLIVVAIVVSYGLIEYNCTVNHCIELYYAKINASRELFYYYDELVIVSPIPYNQSIIVVRR
ncbi:MAG: hypothetical protein DRJ52_09285 [Thermoprotei archaeon]|nr:MAG: hypothetical protein DRJ52_09285 [Thermoprotei archaeon]